MKTVGKLLRGGAESLHPSSGTPQLDAEILLEFTLNISRTQLLADPRRKVSPELCSRFEGLLQRRRNGEPVAYITGVRGFWNEEFYVTPDVLIPRPESEHIIEAALEHAAARSEVLTLVDLGTGSGCLILSLVGELAKVHRAGSAIGVDASAAALAVARINAERLGLAQRVFWLQSDWGAALKPESVDILLCNPPYVSPGSEEVSPEVAFEPRQAVYSGEEGMADILCLLEQAPRLLRSGGIFLCEHGFNQRARIEAHWKTVCRNIRADFQMQSIRDLAGFDRVTAIVRR